MSNKHIFVIILNIIGEKPAIIVKVEWFGKMMNLPTTLDIQ